MIMLVQWLCPMRHLVLGAIYDPNEETFEQAVEAMKVAAVQMNVQHDFCGVCASRELRFEERETEFHTIQEAGPWLLKESLENVRKQARLIQNGTFFSRARRN